MTNSVIQLLATLLCFDAASLDSDYYRLLQAKDAAIRLALDQLAADLPVRLLSEDERETAWALLVAFFARLYRGGETTVSRLPVAIDGIWLDWWYRGQHALGEGPRFRNYTCTVKAPAGEIAVRFIVASAQIARATRGLLLPVPERVQHDAARMAVTLPFAYRDPTADECARWGRSRTAQQRAALHELLPPCVEALAGAALPFQELLKQARAFVGRQWGDRFLPIGLGSLLEARLERYLLARAGPPLRSTGGRGGRDPGGLAAHLPGGARQRQPADRRAGACRGAGMPPFREAPVRRAHRLAGPGDARFTLPVADHPRQHSAAGDLARAVRSLGAHR